MAGKKQNLRLTRSKLTDPSKMHCHIGWHVAEGLALQFVERESEIAALVDTAELEQTCKAWDDFNAQKFSIEQDDSGV